MFLWWYWILIGVALLITDIALVNVYYLIWFGVAAMVVGVGLLIAPDMPLWLQVALFGFTSVAFLLLWLLVVRRHLDKKNLAVAREEIIGSKAVVVRFNKGKGVLRLQKPIGGSDTWRFTSAEQPLAGDTVVITEMKRDGTVQANPFSHTHTPQTS